MLAGVLLKLGLYGIIRVLIGLIPYGSELFSPIVSGIGFVSVIYISVLITRQIDFKKIIAYSSIAHMNFAILGIFVLIDYGMQGAIFTMLSHGVISSMLFFCIGILYDRFGERNILYYRNLAQLMPQFSFIFFVAIIANMGIPGMSSFIGEFLVLLSLSLKSIFLMFVISISLLLTTVYCIWLYNRIAFGNLITNFTKSYKDLVALEYNLGIMFTIIIVIYGIYPNSILEITKQYNIIPQIMIYNFRYDFWYTPDKICAEPWYKINVKPCWRTF